MSSKLTTANEHQGMKNAIGGVVQMTIIKRNLLLWWGSISQTFQEEVAITIENVGIVKS